VLSLADRRNRSQQAVRYSDAASADPDVGDGPANHAEFRMPVRVGLPLQFPDSLFQLGEFADLCELFPCYDELVSLFGRIGNSCASPWNGWANRHRESPSRIEMEKYAVIFAVSRSARDAVAAARRVQ
jgi:hypothetical protein